MKRRVCVVTGSRAEYGTMRQVVKAIETEPKLELKLVAAGSHLLESQGKTIKQIELDGFKISGQVDMGLTGDKLVEMAESVGVGVSGFAKMFDKLKPEWVLVAGDRVEALAASLAASYMNIVVAHYGGGQVSGSVDNTARNVISKVAHLHLVKWPNHVDRLLEIGEERSRIHWVGDVRLDFARSVDYQTRREVLGRYKLKANRPFLLVVFHPETMRLGENKREANELMAAVNNLGLPSIWLTPNADAGSLAILERLTKYSFVDDKVKIVQNVEQDEYFRLMKYARLMLGNSSSMITEGPYFELQAVLVGERQRGRERFDVLFETKSEKGAIVRLAKRLLNNPKARNDKHPKYKFYGRKRASKEIVNILLRTKFNRRLLIKR